MTNVYMCGRNIQVNLVPIILLSPFPTIPLWAPGPFTDHLAGTLSAYTKNRTGFGASFPELATVHHTEERKGARFIIREGVYDGNVVTASRIGGKGSTDSKDDN